MTKTIHGSLDNGIHSKLIEIQKLLKLSNLNDAIAKSIEIAYESLIKEAGS